MRIFKTQKAGDCLMGGSLRGNFGNTKGTYLDETSILDAISNTLALASLMPGVDTFTDIASIPIDLARGDYLSAGLDAFGVIPIIGEVADTAKIARTTDKAIDAAKFANKSKTVRKELKILIKLVIINCLPLINIYIKFNFFCTFIII